MPSVAIFTGHLMDRTGSEVRFPHDRIDSVRKQLMACLERHDVGFGYSAAANGGDLLFIDATHRRNGESHIVLPLNVELFRELSVTGDPSLDWEGDFNRAIERAAEIVVVNEFSRTGDSLHFEYANLVMTGLTILHARSLGVEIVPIAVWDGTPARGAVGTGFSVEVWRRMGWKPHIIDPLRTTEDSSSTPLGRVSEIDVPSVMEQNSSDIVRREIRAMLFADVVGYSKITEEEIPLFVNEFMCRIANSVAQSGVKIETWNTWSDAIFFVFDNVRDAGPTALRITELVHSIDWKKIGFQRQLNLRTGLHVGPVYCIIDPVTRS